MPDVLRPDAARADVLDFATATLKVAPYPPAEAELEAILAYLTEIEDAIHLLPGLEAVEDGLDVGYDPAWAEDAG